jgi:hypothetical protein
MHVTCGAAHDPCPLSSDRVQQYIIREKEANLEYPSLFKPSTI